MDDRISGEALAGAGAGVDSGVSFLLSAVRSFLHNIARRICTGIRRFTDAVESAEAVDSNNSRFASCGVLQTTIMAVAYDGGVIMGADSRTSTGTLRNRS